MKLKFIVAGLLAAVSFGAVAADQINIPVVNGVTKQFTGLSLPGDGLLSGGSDTLTFTGLSAGLYNVVLTYSGNFVNISSASLNNQAPVDFIGGNPYVSMGYFSLTDVAPFTLKLNGIAGTSPLASYNGQITVTAVPEPETYGMLLGGLALLGVVARRKAKKAA